MTLPSDKVGDKGQRYVVECKGWPIASRPDDWQPIAYMQTMMGAEKVKNVMGGHPDQPPTRIIDRREGEPEV